MTTKSGSLLTLVFLISCAAESGSGNGGLEQNLEIAIERLGALSDLKTSSDGTVRRKAGSTLLGYYDWKARRAWMKWIKQPYDPNIESDEEYTMRVLLAHHIGYRYDEDKIFNERVANSQVCRAMKAEMPQLIELVDDESTNIDIRIGIAYSLREADMQCRRATSNLYKALSRWAFDKRMDPRIRAGAIEALATNSVFSPQSAEIQVGVVRILAESPRLSAKCSVSAMATMIHHDWAGGISECDHLPRMAAASALSKFDPLSDSGEAALIATLNMSQEHLETRETAARTLGWRREQSSKALGALVGLIKDQSQPSELRSATIDAVPSPAENNTVASALREVIARPKEDPTVKALCEDKLRQAGSR